MKYVRSYDESMQQALLTSQGLKAEFDERGGFLCLLKVTGPSQLVNVINVKNKDGTILVIYRLVYFMLEEGKRRMYDSAVKYAFVYDQFRAAVTPMIAGGYRAIEIPVIGLLLNVHFSDPSSFMMEANIARRTLLKDERDNSKLLESYGKFLPQRETFDLMVLSVLRGVREFNPRKADLHMLLKRSWSMT